MPSHIVHMILIHRHPDPVPISDLARALGSNQRVVDALAVLDVKVWEDNYKVGLTDQELERLDDIERGPPKQVMVQI
jgi:hypothetical protein